MYARIVKFVLGPDTKWEADRMADVVNMLLKKQRGFLGVHFLADYENGEYEWLAFWERKEDISFAMDSAYGQFRTMIGDNVQWEPLIQVYEAYLPKERRE